MSLSRVGQKLEVTVVRWWRLIHLLSNLFCSFKQKNPQSFHFGKKFLLSSSSTPHFTTRHWMLNTKWCDVNSTNVNGFFFTSRQKMWNMAVSLSMFGWFVFLLSFATIFWVNFWKKKKKRECSGLQSIGIFGLIKKKHDMSMVSFRSIVIRLNTFYRSQPAQLKKSVGSVRTDVRPTGNSRSQHAHVHRRRDRRVRNDTQPNKVVVSS